MIYLTAGESHGPQLTGIIEGLPAGLHINVDAINDNLAKRQGGYGIWTVFCRARPARYRNLIMTL